MADVIGPTSSMPGSHHPCPEGIECDDCQEKPATIRIQGETDSMGAELHDLCEDCAKKPCWSKPFVSEFCDWCKKKAPSKPIRDLNEGTTGPIYYVCDDCHTRTKPFAPKALELYRRTSGGLYEDDV